MYQCTNSVTLKPFLKERSFACVRVCTLTSIVILDQLLSLNAAISMALTCTVERSTGNTQHGECIKTHLLQYAECQCVEKLSAHVSTLNQLQR